MNNYILADNDLAMFLPVFGLATVVTRPGILKGSGKALLSKRKLCLEGDEKQISIDGCIYTTSMYPIPGIGTIKIKSLADNHKAKKCLIKDKPVLLQGGQFTAEFSVMIPAKTPPPSVTTDSTEAYTGYGQFLTKNIKWQSK